MGSAPEDVDMVVGSTASITGDGMAAALRMVMQHSANAMVLADELGVIALVNDQAEQLLHYSQDELTGKSIELLLPAWLHADPAHARAGFPASKMSIITKNGAEVAAEISLSPLKLLDRSFWLVTIADAAKPGQAEERLRSIVDDVSDYGIFTLNAEGMVTSWNVGAERIKGYAKSEILGKHFSCFYPTEDVRSHKPERELKAAEKTGRFEDENWRVRKDGSRFWANVIITARKDHGGKLVGFTKVSRDLTERKSAEERFRLMVEAAPNAMIMVNRAGLITLVNAQTEKLFVYTREELIGQPVEILVPVKIRGEHPRLRDSFFAAPKTRSMGSGRDLYGVTKQGVEVPVEIGLNPIETPEGLFTLASIIDITERKKIDTEMHRLNQSLEAQVTETREALARLRQTQEHLVQAEKMASLGGLVAGVAHEINTPVGICVTAASHLQHLVGQMSRAVEDNTLKRSQLKKFLETAEQASQMVMSNLNRAADLISSFKQVAVDQSSDQPRRVNLAQYIGEILVSLHPKLRSTRIRLEVECDAAIQLETVPGPLSQILTNLILNSILHAYDPGQAGVMKISASVHAGEVTLVYSDDGKGISAEILPKIFDPFFTTKRGHGGTGLGLNIVFNLAHNALGGTIGVASTLGQGTSFTLRLPVKRRAPAREPSAAASNTVETSS